jgi:hypothetical protein
MQNGEKIAISLFILGITIFVGSVIYLLKNPLDVISSVIGIIISFVTSCVVPLIRIILRMDKKYHDFLAIMPSIL